MLSDLILMGHLYLKQRQNKADFLKDKKKSIQERILVSVWEIGDFYSS